MMLSSFIIVSHVILVHIHDIMEILNYLNNFLGIRALYERLINSTDNPPRDD